MSTTDAVVLYSGELDVCYAQFYVVAAAAEEWVDMSAAFAGQTNGLCGGGQPGRLFFVTGTHTGKVRLAVEYTTSRPDVDANWDEQVECSFEVTGPTSLVDWEGLLSHVLQLPLRAYRVRYSARSCLHTGRLNPTRLSCSPTAFSSGRRLRVTMRFFVSMANARSTGMPSSRNRVVPAAMPNPSIERTSSSVLRTLPAAAHVER